jgi:hypothetical protein
LYFGDNKVGLSTGGNMTLANKLEAIKTKRVKKNPCAYMAMYESLSPADQKALDAAWAKGYSANEVLMALRSEGIKSSNEAIRRHKMGACGCQNKTK